MPGPAAGFGSCERVRDGEGAGAGREAGEVSERRTYTVRWRRLPLPDDRHECHHLTAERLVSRLRNALRESVVVIDAVEPDGPNREGAGR